MRPDFRRAKSAWRYPSVSKTCERVVCHHHWILVVFCLFGPSGFSILGLPHHHRHSGPKMDLLRSPPTSKESLMTASWNVTVPLLCSVCTSGSVSVRKVNDAGPSETSEVQKFSLASFRHYKTKLVLLCFAVTQGNEGPNTPLPPTNHGHGSP
jgi:hypothetical protein